MQLISCGLKKTPGPLAYLSWLCKDGRAKYLSICSGSVMTRHNAAVDQVKVQHTSRSPNMPHTNVAPLVVFFGVLFSGWQVTPLDHSIYVGNFCNLYLSLLPICIFFYCKMILYINWRYHFFGSNLVSIYV